MRRTVHLGVTVAICAGFGVLTAACDREQEPSLCPPIGAGDLVITELHAEQGIDGAWIELYNAAAGAVDLHGLEIELATAAGDVAIIRVRHDVSVAAGERTVLSYLPEDRRPAYADYGWYPDFIDADGNPHDLFAASAVEVRACGLRIDYMTYAALPDSGTWSLGVEPPDDAANDDPAAWCDATAPGTPGESNPPCP